MKHNLINPAAPVDKPETEQMKVVHRALTREFALFPALVAAVPVGDVTRAGLVGGHLDLILGMLREHHEAEDELLWPALRARVPLETELIDAMEAQHMVIAASVADLESTLPAWAATARADERADLVQQLNTLEKALTEHLALEESEVLPLIHQHLTVAEWLAPQHHAMAHGPSSLKAKLLLAGAVLEDASPREQTWFLGVMPPPARVMWRLFGARQYASHVRAVRN
ncbi:hemerythrin domain-containing protein [Actinoplanes sp. NPDC020271]|uniref:hemerythrin domain-containing protein n=1 Tax=Actinoplanes sp. NPDC020271 TaxID=3363896 RepID=UPI0037A166AC